MIKVAVSLVGLGEQSFTEGGSIPSAALRIVGLGWKGKIMDSTMWVEEITTSGPYGKRETTERPESEVRMVIGTRACMGCWDVVTRQVDCRDGSVVTLVCMVTQPEVPSYAGQVWSATYEKVGFGS